MKFKRLMLSLVSLTVLAGFSASPTAAKMADYIQQPMPSWYQEGFTRGHLNIPKMMAAGFSRFEAVEIQNKMKDILEANPEYQAHEVAGKADWLFLIKDPLVLAALDQAIQEVKVRKNYESGFQPKPLKSGEFYVVFDLDETLLTHWYAAGEKGPEFYDLKGVVRDTILRPSLEGPDYVSMTPGWQAMFLKLVRLPGCQGIIIFTAKEDASAHSVIDQLKLEERPLRQFLKGVFTRNHLVRDSASVRLSKDLRIIDESLQHVLLLDDNPTRIFPKQQANLREFPKYNPDAYYAAKAQNETPIIRYFEALFPTILAEIEEAVNYSRQNKISFSQAYYPYTMEAQTEMLMLLKQGYNSSQALDFLRKKADIFEPHFYVPKEK